MSIAVSALVRPSRLLAQLSVLMGAVLIVTAVWLEFVVDEPLHHALAAVCASISVALVLFPLLSRKSFRIDITGLGQIRLVDTSLVADAALTNPSASAGEVVQLLRSSTFWSSLMVLRLQSDSGRISVLIIFPDSMDGEVFRALSVACRWIAAHHFRDTAMSDEVSPRSD
jgi:hypothetical protein